MKVLDYNTTVTECGAARYRRLAALIVPIVATIATIASSVAGPSLAAAQASVSEPPRVVAVDASSYPEVSIDIVVPGVATDSTLPQSAFTVASGRLSSVAKLPATTLDVVVVVDDRRTTGTVAFAQTKEVAAQIVGDLPVGTHVAVNTITGQGGLPTEDIAGAVQFVRRLNSVPATSAQTPGGALVRIGRLLQPGAGRRTHLVVVAGDAAQITASDSTALRALVSKAQADVSVITVAKRLDSSAAGVVTAGGVATFDTGTGVSALGEPASAALASRYRLLLTAKASGLDTVTVQRAASATARADFTIDPPGSGPTTSTASDTTSPTTATTARATTTAPATTGATTTIAAVPSTVAATTAATSVAPASVSPATVSPSGAVSPSGTARRSPSRAGLIVVLAIVGVLLGAVAALVAVRRFGRHPRRSPSWIDYDTLRVSPQSDDAWRGGRDLRLDTNERDVLLALVRRPGHIYTREDIAAIAWPERAEVSPRLVATLMDHLQRTVDGFDDAPLIHIVRGAGYVLSDPTDTEHVIAAAVSPRRPQYAPPPHRRASRR